MNTPSTAQPELALIHGWGLGSAVWRPLFDALTRSWRVHLIDLPGYGRSPDDPAEFTATAQHLVDTLPEAITLCGWSLGGLLAMRAAQLAPQRVDRLVLVGATPCFAQRHDWPSAQRAGLLDDFTASIKLHPAQTLQRFVVLLCQGDSRARSLTRELLATLRQAPIPAPAILERGLDWLRAIDLRSMLPTLTQPTLLVHGDRDALNPIAAAHWLSHALRHGRLEIFAGTGHVPFLADSERFVALLDEFRHASPTS